MAMQVQRTQPTSSNAAPAPSRLHQWHDSTAALAAAVAPMIARDRRLPTGTGDAVGPATLDRYAAPAAQPFDFSALDTNQDNVLSGSELAPIPQHARAVWDLDRNGELARGEYAAGAEVDLAFVNDRNRDGYLSGNEISPDLARYAYQAADGRMIISQDHMRSLKLREQAPAPAPTPTPFPYTPPTPTPYAPVPVAPLPLPRPIAPPPIPAPYARPPVPAPYGPAPFPAPYARPPVPAPYAPAPIPAPYAPAPVPLPAPLPAPNPTPGTEAHPHDNRQSWFMGQYGGFSNPNEDTRGNANCGPTCVAMIAMAFGKINPSPAQVDDVIEKTRRMVGESQSERAGTSPHGLDRALEGYGLTSTLRKGMSIEAIKQELAAGRLLIAFVVPTYLGGYSGHFTVVTKIEGDKVFLNDPAATKGPIEVSMAQFKRAIGARGNTLVSAGL